MDPSWIETHSGQGKKVANGVLQLSNAMSHPIKSIGQICNTISRIHFGSRGASQ